MALFRDLHRLASEGMLNKVSAGIVLDVGTGPGYLLVKIARMKPDMTVLGLDISRDMVRMAWANAKKAKLGNVEVIVGDVDRLCLAGQSVDHVVATMTLHHWADPVEALVEIGRVLKHGGEVTVYELDGEPTPRSKAWVKQNYSVFLRFALRLVRGHAITVEHAQKLLSELKHEYVEGRVEQLERPLINMTLIKGDFRTARWNINRSQTEPEE